MIRRVATLAPLFFGLTAVTAFAGGQTETENIPEVLEIRVEVDANGKDIGSSAEVRALNFDDGLPMKADGNVDMDRLAAASEQQASETMTIDSNATATDNVPDEVRELFDQAGTSDERMTFWNFFRPWGSYGLWGYGYRPYYGYYNYGHYPRYGLYHGGRIHHFYPSFHHRRFGGHHRNYYYWRW